MIAAAAIAVGDGDEPAAAALIEDEVTSALDGTDSWYWRDRAVVALAHVLLPDTRPAWDAERMAAAHRHGVVLAEALEAARHGDMTVVASMVWPKTGLVRAHLPVCWIAELVAAAVAAGNPPPADLVDAVGPAFRTALDTGDQHKCQRTRRGRRGCATGDDAGRAPRAPHARGDRTP